MVEETKEKEITFQESFGWYSLILIRAWVYTTLTALFLAGVALKLHDFFGFPEPKGNVSGVALILVIFLFWKPIYNRVSKSTRPLWVEWIWSIGTLVLGVFLIIALLFNPNLISVISNTIKEIDNF